MRDILSTIQEWVASGQDIALATVVSTWGSSPRKTGSKMAIRSDGLMAGSVSGGCVEGAVVENALEILQGAPPRLLKYGVSDDTAWNVGLACGGSIEVFVQRLDPESFNAISKLITANRTAAALTIIEGDKAVLGQQTLFNGEGGVIAGDENLLDPREKEAVDAAFARGQSQRIHQSASTDRALFLDFIPAPMKLVIIGGVHISIALAEIARAVGYQTILIDPRRMFASGERFTDVDELIHTWPQDAYKEIELDRETAIAVLTHDPKIDDPAIIGALEHPVFYIGVLGSRKTHAKRMTRLRDAGCSDQQLDRLHAPIGLHIGAQSPEEIALSIMAEITAARRGINPGS